MVAGRLRNLTFAPSPGETGLAAVVLSVLMIVVTPALAQSYTVLHSFTGGGDGANPHAGVTIDAGGNLYGTTYSGGSGHGTVFKLKRSGSGWVVNPLYSFSGGTDGANPDARVVFGPDGILYGTTLNGGFGFDRSGFGTVFKLRPSPTVCVSVICPGIETVLYTPSGWPGSGEYPRYGDLVFNQAGNIYGACNNGGARDSGIVYQLTPSGSGWDNRILYSFGTADPDGKIPYNGVILDGAGDLYGTTLQGGTRQYGTVFKLTHSGSDWTESLLYSFDNENGSYPYAGLIFDHSGNLYGATSHTSSGGGTVFELSPSNGGWTYSVLYRFTGPPGCGPRSSLVMDEAGNLYGTTYCDGAHTAGNVFKLTNTSSGWTMNTLYDFTGGSDGGSPISNVTLDAAGNLYGTASAGGAGGYGVVWMIAP